MRTGANTWNLPLELTSSLVLLTATSIVFFSFFIYHLSTQWIIWITYCLLSFFFGMLLIIVEFSLLRFLSHLLLVSWSSSQDWSFKEVKLSSVQMSYSENLTPESANYVTNHLFLTATTWKILPTTYMYLSPDCTVYVCYW